MKRFLSFSIAALFVSTVPPVARAQNVAPIELVKRVVAATGCVEALRTIKGVVLKADAQHWEPSKATSPTVSPRLIGDSKLTITWDGEKNVARSDWDREFETGDVHQLSEGRKSPRPQACICIADALERPRARPLTNLNFNQHPSRRIE
jgi:hypothetical protein